MVKFEQALNLEVAWEIEKFKYLIQVRPYAKIRLLVSQTVYTYSMYLVCLPLKWNIQYYIPTDNLI